MNHSNQPLLHNPIPLEGANEDALGKLSLRSAIEITYLMALKSVIELNVLEIIAEAGDAAVVSPDHIAAKLHAKNPEAPIMLDRMLSLLASHSILSCSALTGKDGTIKRLYGLGPLSKFFLKNQGAGSFGPLLLFVYDKFMMESWYHLNDAILEGGVAFNRAFGKSTFEYLKTDRRANQIFNQGLSSKISLVMKKILDVYTGFEDVKVLVDVGGGIGGNLNLIVSKYPNIKGINLDLPHAIATAPSYPGVEHVGGDMFVNIPKGDAIFMTSVLHDWSDDYCLKILKNCYEALPESGKVIVVDFIRPEIPETNDTAKLIYSLDVFMMCQHPGSKERTLKEFQTLATKSGFRCSEVKCSACGSSVLEFYKRHK